MSLRDNRFILVCFIIALFAFFSVAHADESASSGTNTANSSKSDFLDHMHANFFGTLHGPALNHLDAAETVDQNGKLAKSPMYLDSEAGATYMFDNNYGVGAVLPFYLYGRGEKAQIGDAGIKFVSKKTVSDSNFNLYTNFILQFSTSDYSKNRGQEIAFKTTPNVRYTLQGTRYTVGAWTEAKSYYGAKSGKVFKLYAAPYINYQLNPSLSLNLEYEMEADHFAKTSASDFQMYQNDLLPGVVWMITPTVMFNPYLQIFTANKLSSDRMALGALFSASI